MFLLFLCPFRLMHIMLATYAVRVDKVLPTLLITVMHMVLRYLAVLLVLLLPFYSLIALRLAYHS